MRRLERRIRQYLVRGDSSEDFIKAVRLLAWCLFWGLVIAGCDIAHSLGEIAEAFK